MTVKNLTLENYESEIINSDVPVLIDFYADWCGPCQMMKPVFEELSSEYEGKVKFMKLDTQAEEGLAVKFRVQGIPTLVFVKEDQEIHRFVGFMNKDQLKHQIDHVLEAH
jgi:thioredoxin 1